MTAVVAGDAGADLWLGLHGDLLVDDHGGGGGALLVHVARAAAAPHLLHQREDDREDADVEQQVGDRDPVLGRQEISIKLSPTFAEFHIARRSLQHTVLVDS